MGWVVNLIQVYAGRERKTVLDVTTQVEEQMRLQDVSLGLETKNACPICSARISLSEVEPHPSRHGLAIHGYICEFCGPVKSLVVVCPVEEEPRLMM